MPTGHLVTFLPRSSPNPKKEPRKKSLRVWYRRLQARGAKPLQALALCRPRLLRIPRTFEAEETAAADFDEAGVPGAEDPASFINFAMSIASNAASSLGLMEHPVTRKREVDLELGKHWIDVLGMLQKKTTGNLTSAGGADPRGLAGRPAHAVRVADQRLGAESG